MGKDLLDPISAFAGEKDVGDDYDGGQGPGVSIRDNTKTTQKEIPAVYGEVRVGGNLAYIGTAGANNNDLWVVQTLSEGECDSIFQDGGVDQVFLDDKLWNEYSTLVNYYFHAGTSNQAKDANLYAALAEHTDEYHYLCYMVFHCVYDEDYFQSIPDFQTILKGRKVYDFRSATTAWSNNPVLCLHDFLTAVRFGPGLATTKIDYPSWIAAANYCDEKSFTYNNVIAKNQAVGQIIDEIKAHFRGRMNWFDGKYSLRYADLNYESVAMNLTDAHLQESGDGSLAVAMAEPSIFTLPDGVTVKWRDPDNGFVEDDLPVGDEVGVIKTVNLLGCTNREQAGILGIYHLERAILNRTLSATLRQDAIRLEPWDIVKATWTELGLADQYLRVQDVSISKEGIIETSFLYESLLLYNDVFDLVAADSYKCTLPDPASIPGQVTGVTLSEALYDYRLQTYTRLNVSATGPAHEFFVGVNVWKSFDDIAYDHFGFVEGSPGGSVDFSLDPVEEGTTYYLIMTSVSLYGAEQAMGSGYKASRTIQGLTALPQSLTEIFAIANDNTVSVYGQKLNNPDIEIYEFRLGGWTGGIFLASLRSPNLNLQGVKPGDHLFYANTLSTNGFYGQYPRSASTSLIDPPKGWTVQTTYNGYYNLVGNGHFDSNASLWTPVNSTLASLAGGQDGNCLQLTMVSGSFQDAWQEIGVFESVVTIDFEFYVKSGTSGNEAFDFILWNVTDAGYAGTGAVDYSSTTTAAWVKHTWAVTLAATDVGDTLRIYLRKNTATAGTMLFDEVKATIAEEFKNVEYVKYSNDDYLKCSHDGFTTYTTNYWTRTAAGGVELAQAFFPFLNIDALNSIQLFLYRDPSPTGNLYAYIYDDDSEPGTLLATSDPVDVTTIGTSAEWITFNFSTPPALLKNTKYYVVLDGADYTGDSSNRIGWGGDSAGGWGTNRWHNYQGAGWIEDSGQDLCFRIDQYTGRYTSREYDQQSSGTYLIYLLADTIVTGTGTTWGDVIPSPDTWADIGITERTWQEIFALDEAPEVHIRLNWGDVSGSLTNGAEKMEILSTIATGRYFQWDITIRDPSASVEVLVENYIMKLCQ